MTYSPVGSADKFDLAAAFDAAVHGTALKGFTAEICQELSHKHGGGNIRIPLQALVAAKATGAGPLAGFGQAVPLTGFHMDSTVTDIAPAIRSELAATRAGVRMVSTNEALFKLPRVNARPTAAVYDVDEVIANAGDSGFDTVDIQPVVVAGITEIANSLSFARNPQATQIVTQHLSDAIVDAIDAAIWNGYATGSGRTWGGIVANATPSAIALSNASTAQNWRSVVEFQMAAMQTTSPQGMRWVANPAVTSLLMSSPVFVGATNALAQTQGATAPLFGYDWVEALKLPVAALATEVLFGDFSSITAVAFNSASIELISNPYEAAAFSKGSTMLRAIASIGVGMSDTARICKSTVSL